ncbi:MAG: spermidine/putrescine ABC transporter substrate-binding protein, partial [Gemmobacter sp.]|nr:spermidine/putrescine ABC transporter substrate-binding protein [Gemmobacter sp.]
MKRVLLATTLCALPMAAAAEGELNLYVWSDSIDPALIAKFEAEAGVKV